MGGLMPVTLDITDGIALIRSSVGLDDPALREALATASGADAIVLHGAFFAGIDLRRVLRTSAEEIRARDVRLRALFADLVALPVPVVAAIGGSAFGRGCDLALACDLRVLAADGQLGCVTGHAVLVGRGIGAEEALRTGLVDRVVPAGSVVAAARDLAAQAARKRAQEYASAT
jgi:enoyl-CoA hydratase/carnithine racemase